MFDETQDLAGMFDSAELAVDAVWSGAPTVTLAVHFLNPYAGVLGLGDLPMSSRAPRAIVQAADVPTVAVGQTLTIAAVAYIIRDVQADATGRLVTLELQVP